MLLDPLDGRSACDRGRAASRPRDEPPGQPKPGIAQTEPTRLAGSALSSCSAAPNSGLGKVLEIIKISMPTAGFLVLLEVVEANETYRGTVNGFGDARLVALSEVDTGDGRG